MKRIMIDLETPGTRPGSVILSIGAVVFSDMQIQETFYERINPSSCIYAGLSMDIETIMWWMNQSNEARSELFMESSPITSVLTNFRTFIYDLGLDIEIWGNGSDFDNALLAEAYRRIGSSAPWKFWHNRCYRTMKSLYPQIKMERSGTHHNALDDARSQAMHLMSIFNSIKD